MYSSLSWLVSSGARYISLMKDSLSNFGNVVRAIVISNTLPNKGANQLKTQRRGKKARAPQLPPPPAVYYKQVTNKELCLTVAPSTVCGRCQPDFLPAK